MEESLSKTGEWHWVTDLRCPANPEPEKEKSVHRHIVKALRTKNKNTQAIRWKKILFSKKPKLDWQLVT